MRQSLFILVAGTMFSATPLCLNGQTTSDAQDEEAIRATAASYREAFNRGDARALAAHWIENGEYIDQTGLMFRGRESIEKSFERFFSQHQGTTIEINIKSINFPRKDLAVEIGSTRSTAPGEKPAVLGQYAATHVKQNGQWLLYRVHEAPPPPPSNYDHLKDLEWLLGSWVDHVERDDNGAPHSKPVVFTTCRWTVNGNFLVRNFTATLNGQVTSTGTQHIGWYAPTKQIRSWTFDSKGHVIAGIWTKNGDQWTVKTHEGLRTGETATATEIVTVEEDGTQIWRTTGRSVGGETLPDDVVKVTRHR